LNLNRLFIDHHNDMNCSIPVTGLLPPVYHCTLEEELRESRYDMLLLKDFLDYQSAACNVLDLS